MSERLPVANTGDELERLSVSLNRMITRLDDAFQNSKRFVADASHDLRTPLTILRGELENLAEDARLDAELRDRAGSMLEEAVHLGKIVEQLFTLSRLDAGEAQTEWTRFDLAELAKTTAEQMSLLAEDKGISISCDAGQPVPVKGNRVRLKQVVVNLLDNAIKYTPAQGRDPIARARRQRPRRAGSGRQRHRHSARCVAAHLRAVLSGWTRRAPPNPKARAWAFPSSNPFAPRTARKWKRKAPLAAAVVFASGCRCSKTENFTRS